jgi:RNA polymerase sigma-70 factor, ECF subfamily
VGRKKKNRVVERETFAHEAMIHLDHLYRVAFHLGKDQDQAQDLVQETFVRALASSDQFNPGTNMKAWLTRILYNYFFDSYRHSKRWISTDDSTDPRSDYSIRILGENPGPERQFLLKELNRQITDVLKKIPDEFRAPIILVDMGDFSYDEAAEILSCPIGTIRSRLSRGRRLMHRYLRAYVEGNQEGAKRK